ncbi:phage holin family protein [Candidatus Daviesbacteria bacterium]|nr:phage holin family protein [Candidatus Daviesbacteria bacterium]
MTLIEFNGIINLMHIIVVLLLNSLALMITDYIVPGFGVEDFPTAVLAAIVLGVINTFIKPILLILTAPINILTLGLFTFVVNAIVLWIAAAIVPGLTVSGFYSLIYAS